MRDFPSCFGENGVQVADSSSSSSSSSQNTVTCVYQTHLAGRPCKATVTWTRTLMGQGFTIGVSDDCAAAHDRLCKVEIKPWLFSKRKGSKSMEVVDAGKVDVFWNLAAAKFGPSPEPLDGFFVALVSDRKIVLLLGDMEKEAVRKTSAAAPPPSAAAALVSKKEHIFGKKVYSTKARFCDNGRIHEVAIDCETVGSKDPCLEIRIDRKRVVQVKRLAWKFRGNQTILIDGLPVEVFWDVHGWLFGSSIANAVFMFQTCLAAEKMSTWVLREEQLQNRGFSLLLHAWKNE